MMTNEKHLDSMSPDTKRVYTDTLRRKRKIVVDKMKIEEDYGDDKYDLIFIIHILCCV